MWETIRARSALLVALVLLAAQAAALYLMGQPLICECGYAKVWEGIVLSPGNSQHITDWYTFSHVLHGLLFYALLWYFFPRLSVGMRLLFAFGIEIGWEILENTPMVIDHYRQQALAQGYTGDSVLNSISDTVAMAVGFLAAWRLPVWSVVVIGLVLEIFVLYAIRDNLTLNILNLIHQFDFISAWQAAG